ncbi:MAG: DegV family protein [Fusicatenibacter sp.]|nr:DegV family protein [Fusicatenibacter sp.]
MRTAIVTDTNSGITVESGRSSGIYVLPMPLIIEETSYMEGVNITNDQVYQALRSEQNLASSQPSPGDVMALWDRIFDEGYDELLYIPMSSALSGSCSMTAQLALDYHGKVQVADNHRISVTLMESVYDAKALADEGMTASQIKAYLEENAYAASIYLSVDSLKQLKKGGRITPAAAALGSILNIKPLLTIQGEKLDLFAKVRGTKQCEKKMIEALQNDLNTRFAEIPKKRLRIATAGTLESEEDAAHWLNLVQNAFPDYPVYYAPLSCSIACHVGVNAAGIGVSVIADCRRS